MGKAGFETVIGLEVHVQLLTKSKMFCRCENRYGGVPNSRTCPVCLALPGALPTVNDEAVKMAVALGLGIHGEIRERSDFYRKQYFYPDLPKGYQITQGPVAVVENGWLEIPGDPAVRGAEGPIRAGIERAHLEEDSGKSSHDGGAKVSLVDLNRAGVPLLEIVGRPDLCSPREASEFMKALRRLVVFLGICDGNMEEGSLRCDANLSVRPAGSAAFGTRVEIKNINSFRNVKLALEFEADRQIGLLARGETFEQETRGWDAARGETLSQRSKEAAMDYRYFPEPDLPALTVAPGEVEAVRARLPELPEARKARLMSQDGLTEYEASMVLQDPGFADYYEAVARGCGNGRQAANWMLGEVSRALNERGTDLAGLGLEPGHLAALVRMVEARKVNLNTAKEGVFPALLRGEGSPEQIVEQQGLAQVSDRDAVEALVRGVLAAHGPQVAELKSGNLKLRGFLVGQIMKAGRGKVDPRMVNGLLDAALDEPGHD